MRLWLCRAEPPSPRGAMETNTLHWKERAGLLLGSHSEPAAGQGSSLGTSYLLSKLAVPRHLLCARHCLTLGVSSASSRQQARRDLMPTLETQKLRPGVALNVAQAPPHEEAGPEVGAGRRRGGSLLPVGECGPAPLVPERARACPCYRPAARGPCVPPSSASTKVPLCSPNVREHQQDGRGRPQARSSVRAESAARPADFH